MGALLCDLSVAHPHSYPWLSSAPRCLLPPRQEEEGTGLGVDVITWGQATGLKPLSTTHLMIIPPKVSGTGLQGLGPPPLPCLARSAGLRFSNRCFHMEASPAGRSLVRPILLCPNLADTFYIHLCLYNICHNKKIKKEKSLSEEMRSSLNLSLFFCHSVSLWWSWHRVSSRVGPN